MHVGALRGLSAAGLVVALLTVGCAAKHRAPPVEPLPEPLAVYGRLPNVDHVALSPDGARVAFVKGSADNQSVVALISLADRKLLATLRVGDAKVRNIGWLDEDRLLLQTSATATPVGLSGLPREWFMLQTYDVATQQTRPLLGREDRTMNVAWGRTMVRRVGGRTMLFVGGYYATDRIMPGLFRIDVASGDERLVHKGSSATHAWLVDDTGKLIAEEEYHDDEQRWAFRVRRNGTLGEVATGHDPFNSFRILGFGADGDSLMVQVLENDDPVWKSLSLQDGTWGAEKDPRMDDPILDRLSDRVIGRVRWEDSSQYTFLDSKLQTRWDQVLRDFAGERVKLVSRSDDFSKVVVLVEGPRDGYAYELVDTIDNRVDVIGAVYDGLPELAEVRRITYPAADGLMIPAYLTLPNGRPPRNLPLVVLPHGGPAARDGGAFDWWAQGLAAAGYAVLQPNFRGSTISPRFVAAGFGEWGRKMQTDLSDGVRFLAREGTIDPTRVCIVGGSYGGYAALAGVTLDSGVYRCAASVAGLSDLSRFLWWVKKRDGRGNELSQRWWDRFMGAASKDDPILDNTSPNKHVQSVNAPVLLIHGRDDTIVPYEQSEMMATALEHAGKPAELVALDGEDHWLSRSTTRLQMLEHVLGFLKVHNPAE